jgi:2,3-diaminopropionate biosynthesis protein SbnA
VIGSRTRDRGLVVRPDPPRPGPSRRVPSGIAHSIADCVGATPVVRLARLFRDAPFEVLAKLELLNPGGSIKDRSARFFVEEGLRQGWLGPGSHLVESSSGNLGIALAMITRAHDLAFTCVVDPKISSANLAILRQLGAGIELVQEPDAAGGFLHARIRRVQELCQEIPGAVWVNQYANELAWRAHYEGIGGEILRQVRGRLDAVVVAVSTTGTAMGIARRLRERWPRLELVAVDAVGSVIFGGSPAPRDLPGIGSSRVPEILDVNAVDRIIEISDVEAAHACRALLAQEGIFAGGSSGSVVAAIARLEADRVPYRRIITVIADRGERYLDLVYDDGWLAAHQG